MTVDELPEPRARKETPKPSGAPIRTVPAIAVSTVPIALARPSSRFPSARQIEEGAAFAVSSQPWVRRMKSRFLSAVSRAEMRRDRLHG